MKIIRAVEEILTIFESRLAKTPKIIIKTASSVSIVTVRFLWLFAIGPN